MLVKRVGEKSKALFTLITFPCVFAVHTDTVGLRFKIFPCTLERVFKCMCFQEKLFVSVMILTRQRKQMDKDSVGLNRAKVDTNYSYDFRGN